MCPITAVYSSLRTGLGRPWVFQEVEAPRFQDTWHMKVLRLSALRTGHLYPPGNIPGTPFCKRLSRPQGHSAAGRIMKNSSDTIGNRTRNLPACSAVLQPTRPPRAPYVSLIGTDRRAVVYSALPLFGFTITICINYWLLRPAYVRVLIRHSHECTTSVQTKRKCKTHSGNF